MTTDLRASIVERMAKALNHDDGAQAWDDALADTQEWYRNLARIALTASCLMEAVEALEPFAAFVPKMEEEFPNEPDDAIYSMVGENEIDEAVITHGDLRRARAALAKIKGE